MKYYVCMTDKFMSGWGMAEGRKNKLVIECDHWDVAQHCEYLARKRGEMTYININMHKPYYNPKTYYVSHHKRTVNAKPGELYEVQGDE